MANITSAASNLPGITNASVLDTSLSAMKEGLDRLSGGIRVRLARDDGAQDRGEASRLALGDRWSADVQTWNQASLHVNDGIAMAQVAGAGLDDIHAGLQQLQQLATASRSGALSDADRAALQEQAQQIQDVILQKVHTTRYNDIPLLATTRAILLQTGIDTPSQTTIELKDWSDQFTPVDLTSVVGGDAATVALKKDREMVENAQVQLAAKRAELLTALNTLHTWSPSLTGVSSFVNDDQAAQTLAGRIAALVRNNAGMAFHVQANQSAARVQHLL
ncbi:MAG: hypothetical protein H7838_00880 [Magnetococcus sp. DMHC-8]